MENRTRSVLAALAMLPILYFQPLKASAQGTAFEYLGQLATNGAPANGYYDMTFALYTTNVGGSVVAGPVTNSAIVVSNGTFIAILDFGAGVFSGTRYWLDITVSPAGSNTFVELTRRQPLLTTPYAIMAENASNLLGTVPAAQLAGTIPLGQLPAAVVTNNSTGLNLSGIFSGNGSGLTNVNASATAPLSQGEASMDNPTWVQWKAGQVDEFANIGKRNFPNTISRLQNGRSFKVDLAGTGFMSWMASDLATNFLNQFPLAGQAITASAGNRGAVIYFSTATNLATFNNNSGGWWFTGTVYLTNSGAQTASAGVIFNSSFASRFKFNQIEYDTICGPFGANITVSTNNSTGAWVAAATLNTLSSTLYGTNWVVSLPAYVSPGQSIMFSQTQHGTNLFVDCYFENTAVTNGIIIGDDHIGAAGHFDEYLAVSNSIVAGIYSGMNAQLYLFQDIDSSGEWITNGPRWFTFLRTNNPDMDICVANIPPQPADGQGGDSDSIFLSSIIFSNALSSTYGFNLFDWRTGMENTNNEIMRGWTTNGDGSVSWPHLVGTFQGWDGFSAGSYMWYRWMGLQNYSY